VTSPSAATPESPRRVRTRFGPEPIVLFPLLIALLGAVPAAATWPALSWVLLLPVLGAVWVLRAKVLVRPEALVVCNGLRRQRVPWSDVDGFDVPRRGFVRLLHAGRRTRLTAVPRRELGRLVAAAEQVAGPGGPATTRSAT
jgi:hypothetical protein